MNKIDYFLRNYEVYQFSLILRWLNLPDLLN